MHKPGDKVKAKIAAEVDLLVKQIEKSFGPCNLIDFDPSSLALVIDHNASAHEKISKFLQLRAPSAEHPIRLSVIGVSSEWMFYPTSDWIPRFTMEYGAPVLVAIILSLIVSPYLSGLLNRNETVSVPVPPRSTFPVS